jgi:hypothetical protein
MSSWVGLACRSLARFKAAAIEARRGSGRSPFSLGGARAAKHVDHARRGVNQRYYPMRGFASFVSALRFCSAFDELREFFQCRSRRDGVVSLPEQRRPFVARWRSLRSEATVA